MSLQQAISTHARARSSALHARLVEAMESVPDAAGLALGHTPSGARGILVIDATGAAFVASEQLALERLHLLKRLFPDRTIDMVCIPAFEAQAIETDLDLRMDVHRYKQEFSGIAAPHRR
jgi:hypothetical protein